MTKPKAILSDFSWVLLHPKDRTFKGSPNALNREQGGENGMGAYPFFDFFELNTKLLEYIALLKRNLNIPLYIFTTDIIQDRPEIRGQLDTIFNRIISGREIKQSGASKAESLHEVKTDPKAYTYIASITGLPPAEILFIDDKEANLKAAQSVGYQVLLYARTPTMEESNQKAIAELSAIFA